MAIQSSYTEAELMDYMLTVTQQISDVANLTAPSFAEAVNDTLLACGLDDIADANTSALVRKLRTLAKVEAWRAVVAATANQYDMSRDSGESQVWDKLNQLHTNAKEQLKGAQALAESLGYTDADATYNTVNFGTVTYIDPYSITEDE